VILASLSPLTNLSYLKNVLLASVSSAVPSLVENFRDSTLYFYTCQLTRGTQYIGLFGQIIVFVRTKLLFSFALRHAHCHPLYHFCIKVQDRGDPSRLSIAVGGDPLVSSQNLPEMHKLARSGQVSKSDIISVSG
jgi:hypothetical protein